MPLAFSDIIAPWSINASLVLALMRIDVFSPSISQDIILAVALFIRLQFSEGQLFRLKIGSKFKTPCRLILRQRASRQATPPTRG